MEKNVSVIDGSGKTIGTTYPKRAKGLVKSGRARYVSCESKDTICLTCPPDKMEDKTMTDNSLNVALTETCDNAAEAKASANSVPVSPKPSAEYALMMLEYITKDTEAIKAATSKVSDIINNGLAQIIEAREKTNRELIAFYSQMYEEFKPVAPKKSNTVARFEEIAAMLRNMNRNDYDEEAWETLMDAAETQLSRNY